MSLFFTRRVWLSLLSAMIVSAAGCNQSTVEREDQTASGDTSVDPKTRDKSAADRSANNGTDEGEAASAKPIARPDEPRELMEKMAQRYQSASRYSDRGRVELKIKRGEEVVNDRYDYAVSFQRPDKIRVDINKVHLASNADRWRVFIDEEGWRDNLLDIESPSALSMQEIYGNPPVADRLRQGMIGGDAMQLVLLLSDKPLAFLETGQPELEYLDDEKIGSAACFRVSAKVAEPPAAFVYWIDQRTLTLRRLECPTDELRRQVASDGKGDVDEVLFRVEFEGASFSRTIPDEEFTIAAPPDAKLVTHFDPRKWNPPPPGPSKLLGQAVPEFEFKTLDGEKIDREGLKGSVNVILFWQTANDYCFSAVADLDQIARKYEDTLGIRFLAVNVDPPEATDEDIQKTVTAMEIKLPTARAGQSAIEALDVTLLPNLLVLDGECVLQDNEVGYLPELATELPSRLKKLLAGQSILKETRLRHAKRLHEYEQSLASVISGNQGAESVKAEIAERSEPTKIKLELAWTCDELKAPGNIVAVSNGESARLFVIDTLSSVAELDMQGSVAQRHDLKIGGSAVTFLRTMVDSEGHRLWCALSAGAQHLFVFDDKFQERFSFPDSKHAGIVDAIFADLEGGSPALYVGYSGDVGVQRVNLDGERAWGNRKVQEVYRLGVVRDPSGVKRLACVDGGAQGQGSLAFIEHDGESAGKLAVQMGGDASQGNWYVRFFSVADLDGDDVDELLGLAPTEKGEAVIGFSPTGETLWQVPLAAGYHETPVEPVIHGRFREGMERQWVVAGPDGSITFLAQDGEVIDQFATGERLQGLAFLEQGDERWLIFSGESKKITAYRVVD